MARPVTLRGGAVDLAVMVPEVRRSGLSLGGADLTSLYPGTERYDAAWLGKMLSYLPPAWRKRAEQQHADRTATGGEYAGNTWLRELAREMRQGGSLGLDATDREIRAAANEAAATLFDLAADEATGPAVMTLAGLRAKAEGYCMGRGILPPDVSAKITPDMDHEQIEAAKSEADRGALARMFAAHWWLRRLRAAHGRRLEKHAQRMGYVHRAAGCYVSNENLRRRREQRKRNAAAMEATTLVNQYGDEFTLAKLAEKSNANPRIRRGELMTRISGFEWVAKGLGHVAEMWTVTAPSRFHAVLSYGDRGVISEGVRNPHHDGSTARDGQAHLVKAWAQCRAAMARREIRPYGFRIAEPHHDGCPHWHLLMFLPAEQVEQARALVTHYFLEKHDPEEKGARKRRCRFVPINPKRGSAAGYVAKYVAKNIDGFGLESDLYGNDEVTTAERVDAWAATWGVRQFQQIGGAPVGVWRELRRLTADDDLTDAAEAIRSAADRGDWEQYTKLQGGPAVKRAELPVRTEYTKEGEKFDPVHGCMGPAVNCYGEQAPKSIYGVRDVRKGCAWLTRKFRWTVKGVGDVRRGAGDSGSGRCDRADVRGGGAGAVSGVRGSGFSNAEGGAAWTRVNNCTGNEDDTKKKDSGGGESGAGCLGGCTGAHQGDGGEVGGTDYPGLAGDGSGAFRPVGTDGGGESWRGGLQ